MVIAGFDRYDLHNTPMADGASFTIWFAGCTHGCKGCQNQSLWDKNNGERFDVADLYELIVNETEKTNIRTVTLLGGEPLQQDLSDITALCIMLKEAGYTIWLYTGYTLEEVQDIAYNAICYVDYIKCGKYDEDLRLDDGSFPITSNQRLYHCEDQLGNKVWTRIK